MLQRLKISRILMVIISLAIALGLKYHYSHSRAEDLDWMLAPASYLVQTVSGITFEKVDNTGYVDRAGGIIIAPSCSGINFMIIVFCLSAYMGLKKVGNIFSSFMWVLFSITASYFYTLIVNTFRILISIYSFKTGFLQLWLSGETVHLLEGVIIYFTSLLIYYSLSDRIINPDPDKYPARHLKLIKAGLLPMFFYFSVTLIVPVINNGGFPPNNNFINYAAIVLTACPAVLVLFFSVRACCHYLSVRLK